MKRRRISLVIISLAFFLLVAQVVTCYGGSINENEQGLISLIKSETFHFQGKSYKATEWGLASLEAKLSDDQYDLTKEQVDKAISLMYSNVDIGINDGYLAEVGHKGNKGVIGRGDINDKTKSKGTKSIFEDKTIGQVPVIKNTGFSFNIIAGLLGVLVMVVVAAGYIRGKKKTYKKLLSLGVAALLLGITIGISEPILNLFQLQLEASTIMGDPNKVFFCENKEAMYPTNGLEYGTITCSEIDLNVPLYYGDSNSIFKKGAGQYTGDAVKTGIPGQGNPIIIGGHDMTFFAPLADVKEGQVITINTSYGVFEYKVTKTKVAKYDDKSAYATFKGEKLVLYTCYPMGALFGQKDDRFFVYADKVSGPVIGKVAKND